MTRTFSDGTSIEDIKKRSDDELADQAVREILGKSFLIGVPLAAGIAVASHYLENTAVPQEYIQQVPYIARLGIDTLVGFFALEHAMKPLISLFDYYTNKKITEREHSGNGITGIVGHEYMNQLKE
jgi:hypothetical protein